MIETAYIALGSNLGDRSKRLAVALESLRATDCVELTAVSAVRETDAIGPPAQGRYLNAVARIRTSLSPRDLLALCHEIEAEGERRRKNERVRWGPRSLDLDILLYGNAIIDEPDLSVPHPRLHERDFVLEPLAELEPELCHPVLGITIRELRDNLGRGRAEVSSANPPGVQTP